MLRYIVLGLAGMVGSVMSTAALAQAGFSTEPVQLGHYLLAKGQEGMGTNALDDEAIDMTPDPINQHQDQRLGNDEQPDSPSEMVNDKHGSETTREPTKWREDSNSRSYLGDDDE
ncbi:hypothetical protein [Phytohalomonas tamaricis]|uniref:hypothetical protein n=1 Tax=Phytohalomonas tamaricis TaxID=2081032 RepID=UPI00131A03EE|nr:hypothetical protein [Phytohalomonas tamaricis]